MAYKSYSERQKEEKRSKLKKSIFKFGFKMVFYIGLFTATVIYADNIKHKTTNIYQDNLGVHIDRFFSETSEIDSTKYLFKSDTTDVRKAISNAMKYLGTPYLMGGKDSNAIDCSGLVWKAYGPVFGVGLEHAQGYERLTRRVDDNDIKPGDLMFLDKDGNRAVDHVVIYLGNNIIIHSRGSKGVVIEEIPKEYINAITSVGRF